jgi:hypothetical protein
MAMTATVTSSLLSSHSFDLISSTVNQGDTADVTTLLSLMPQSMYPTSASTVMLSSTKIFSLPTAFPSMWPQNQTITCPAANNTGYNTEDGSLFGIECYKDYGSSVLKRRSLDLWQLEALYKRILSKRTPFSTNTTNECIDACQADAQCIAISWIAGAPGTCYLYGTLARTPVQNSMVWGAVVVRRGPDPATVSLLSVSGALPSGISNAMVTNPNNGPSSIGASISISTLPISTITVCKL